MKPVKPLIVLLLTAAPAFAESEPFFSLDNTEFVVIIAFLLYLGILVYKKVPGIITGMLDRRAEGIQSELDEARALREEAQSILASYERKQKEVQELADRIVSSAKAEANIAADQAKKDLKVSIERRLAGAEEQLASAQAAAVKEVRDTAVSVAISAAREVIAENMSVEDRSSLVDAAIKDVGDKLH